MSVRILLMIVMFAVLPLNMAIAAGAGPKPPQQDWSFSGPFGTYDRAAMQRGLKVYREVCAACHGMKRIYFRNLEALDYSEAQVKNIAAEYTVIDGPDSEGEMFERAAKPSDAYPSPYPNKQAATAANGAYPPDLSLITKARPNGADYLFGLLTGYKEPPAYYLEHNDPVPEGKYYNKYYPCLLYTSDAADHLTRLTLTSWRSIKKKHEDTNNR